MDSQLLSFALGFAIVLISHNMVSSEDKLGHLCDITKCSRFTYIDYPNSVELNLSSTYTDITIYRYPKSTKIHTLIKMSNWKQCSPGMSWSSDVSGGERLDIEKEEAKSMIDKHQCKSPYICKDSDDCVGDQSSRCGKTDFNVWKDVGGFSFNINCDVRNWARWTCYQDISCTVDSSETPVFIGINSDMTPYAMVKTPGKDSGVKLDEDMHYIKDKIHFYVPKMSENPIIEKAKARCYYDSTSHVCRIESGTEEGLIIEMTNGGVLRENKAFVMDKIPTQTQSFKDYDASSISDLKKLFEVIEYVQMQNELNLLKVSQQVQKAARALVNVIKSVAKVDDTLVGSIQGNPSKTVWITPDVFKQCSCSQITDWDWVNLSNGQNPCSVNKAPAQLVEGGYVYTEMGVEKIAQWKEAQINGACAVNNNTVDKVKLDFEEMNILYDHITVPEFTGVSSDWDGMTGAKARIRDLEDNIKDRDKEVKKGSAWEEFANGIPGLSGLGFIFSNISWIALGISVIALLRS